MAFLYAEVHEFPAQVATSAATEWQICRSRRWRLEAAWTVALGEIGCVAAAPVLASHLPTLRRLVRPMYVQRGILPEIAGGMLTAAQVEQVIPSTLQWKAMAS